MIEIKSNQVDLYSVSNLLPIPPIELRFMQESEELFLEIGDGLVAQLKAIAGLTNNSSLVDIGSGYGRLAHALFRAGFSGKYQGMEILKRHVTWCKENLSTDQIKFSHLDIYNSRYNPSGSIPADKVKLDRVADQSDLIVLTSVFTHMLPTDIENYIDCCSRMLLSGGRVCATFFLLNEQRRTLIENEQSRLPLSFKLTNFSLYHNEKDPLHAIAFDESWVFDLIQSKGMEVKQIHHGFWCDGNLTNTSQYQDFVVFGRKI
jgi:SAM-dependent methyltransferase